MAFAEVMYDRKERFSLLLLEPGEIYFQDFSAFHYPNELPPQEAYKKRQRGRLKLCSKSILFDPKDTKYPILKFAFRDILAVDKWDTPVIAQFLRMEGSQTDCTFFLESDQVVKMKENNGIQPYIFERKYAVWQFSLAHSCTDDLLPFMSQLHRASTLPLGDQSAMISAIVLSRQSRVKFDTSWLEDLYESIVMETQADQVSPLVINPGRLMLTSSRLYFQPFNNIGPLPVLKIKLSSIRQISKRRFLLRPVGLEIFCRDSPSNRSHSHVYLSFKDAGARNDFFDALLDQKEVSLDDLGQENMTLRWQNGVISNFEYLMFLNTLADRSMNDLTQYPVFPWVISNYSCDKLDLSEPSNFRDLGKPMGALDSDRLLKLLERYDEMPEPRFLYGSHYSTPGYVLFYLARIAPEYMLCLQNGKFDHPDRMFNSIADAWRNCLTSMSDFKELIPEFYDSDGEFLCKNPLINLGTRQDGRPVSEVELPPWASSPKNFIEQMRAALESDYVSQNLHKWIDLIFGYKQTGEEAENAYNVFFHLTYEGAVNLESIADPNQRAALETQIMEFGQTPKQLFVQPHPKRAPVSARLLSALMASPSKPESPVTANEHDEPGATAGDANANADECNSTSNSPLHDLYASVCDLELLDEHKFHKEAVTDIRWSQNGDKILSVSLDGLLKMYSVPDKKQLRSVNLSHMPLSSCELLPDSKTIIVGGFDNYLYLYNMEYGKIQCSTYAHDDAVSALELNGDLLASASWDSLVKLWHLDYEKHKVSAELKLMAELEHDTEVICLCMTRDRKKIFSATKDGQMHIWDTETLQLLSRQQSHVGEIHAMCLSPDHQQLISCGADQGIRVFDVNTGSQTMAKDLPMELTCLEWDGTTVLGGTTSGHLVAWDLVELKLLKHYQAHKGLMRCMRVSPDGKLATGGEDRLVQIWHPQH